MLNGLLGRGQAPDATTEIAAAQERYQPWGRYLDQQITELHTLLGTADMAGAVTTPPAPTDGQAATPLDVGGFALVED